MIATQIALGISGQDKTAAAFAAVSKRADRASAGLSRRMMVIGASLGAIGVGAAIKQGIDGLSNLYTEAQKAGTSAGDLQKLVGALDAVNIKGADASTMARGLAKMAQVTGRVGAEGFKEVLSDIAAIGDEGSRIKALGEVFGLRLGSNLAPLVRQGPEAFEEGLDKVMAMMPGVADGADAMGGKVNTAMGYAAATVKTAWMDALANVLGWAEKTFGMDFQEAITAAVANVKWAVGLIIEAFKVTFGNIWKVVRFFWEDWRGALAWAWNGIKTFATSIFDFFKAAFSAIGRLAVEFGKQIWNAIKGEGFDWSAITDAAKKEFAKVSEAGKNVLRNAVPSSSDKIKFDAIDWDAQKEKRRDAVKTALEGVAAQSLLATGTVVEGVAEESVKKIKAAMKDVTFTAADSYAALKAAMGQGGKDAGMGEAMGGGTGQGAGSTVAKAAEKGNSLMNKLIAIVERVERDVKAMGGNVARLEAI